MKTAFTVLFRFVSFRFILFRSSIDNRNCREVENCEAKTDLDERSRVRKVGWEWQIVATVQLEALKAIAVFEASVQPHDTSPSREYLSAPMERHETAQNETKRNETKRNGCQTQG